MYGRDTISTILTIAGSDNTGGAGIQADIKTAAAFGVSASSVVTAITSQTPYSITSIFPIPEEILENQLLTIFETFRPDAVKVGMIPSEEAVDVIAHTLKKFEARNIVVDPVIVTMQAEVLKVNNRKLIDKIK